jgi:hypothetical protein
MTKGKNKKQKTAAPKQVTKTSVAAAPKQVAKAPATSNELMAKITAILKEEGALGYIVGVVGSDSKILPYAGAGSIGDLLTIKYVVEKEISKLIDGTTKSSPEAPAASAQ